MPQVLPQLLLHASHAGGERPLREAALEQLGHLVSLIGLHARAPAAALDLVRAYLRAQGGVRTHAIALGIALPRATRRVAPHLASLIAPSLGRLEDTRRGSEPYAQVLHALEVCDQRSKTTSTSSCRRSSASASSTTAPAHARMRAVGLVGRLCTRLDLREYASQRVHAMVRVLRSAEGGRLPARDGGARSLSARSATLPSSPRPSRRSCTRSHPARA